MTWLPSSVVPMDASGIILGISRQRTADITRCMTTTAGNPVLELEYPRAFANAVAPNLASHGKRFRYLHLSGGLVERDQTRSLWIKANVRKTKVCDIVLVSEIDRNWKHTELA